MSLLLENPLVLRLKSKFVMLMLRPHIIREFPESQKYILVVQDYLLKITRARKVSYNDDNPGIVFK